MKKILSLVLVIALVLGSFSFAFAAGHAPDVDGTVYEESVEVLMALGVVNGYPDGEYKPERVVTRAEMAKLLVEALGYGQLASGTAPYSDTAGHWAQGSIAIASGIGLVQGYPDGTFKPDASVSFDEAVTMILRALGYTDESLRGSWPTNYKIKAIDLGLYDDTTVQTGGANRGNVAIMLFNALHLVYGDVNADGVWMPNATTDAKKLIDRIGAFKTDTFVSATDLEDLDTAIDLTPYLYQDIEYYENADGEVAYVSAVNTKTFVGEVTTTSATTVTVKPATGDSKTFTTTGTPLFYNGVEAVAKAATTLDATGKAMVTVVYSGTLTTPVVVGVVAWEVTQAVLVDAAYAEDDTDLAGINLPMDGTDVDLTEVTVVGDVNSITAIAKNDVVYAYAAQNDAKVKLEVVRDVVSGVVTQRTADYKTVVLGGVTLSNPNPETLDLGNTYSVALGKDGKIFDIIDTTVAAPANYAVVKATAAQTTDGAFGAVVLGKIQALITSGDVVVFELVEDLTLPSPNAKITYTLNTSGQITTYSAVNDGYNATGTFNSTFNLVKGEKLLSDDVIIFDLEDWNVVEASDLGASITASALLATDTNYIKVLYVTDKGTAAAATQTYAVVTGVNLVLDGGEVVQQVTHYLDAMYPVVTNTNANGVVDLNTEVNVLVSVTLNTAGKLTAVTAVTPTAANTTVTAVTGNLLQISATGTTFHEVASDVVVYLVEDGEVVGVGTMADVTVGANVTVHKLGTTPKVEYIFVNK